MKDSLTTRDNKHQNHVISKLIAFIRLLDPIGKEVLQVRGELEHSLKGIDVEYLREGGTFSGFIILETTDVVCIQDASNPQEMVFVVYDKNALYFGETFALKFNCEYSPTLSIKYKPGRFSVKPNHIEETWWDNIPGFSDPSVITKPNLISGIKKSHQTVSHLIEMGKLNAYCSPIDNMRERLEFSNF